MNPEHTTDIENPAGAGDAEEAGRAEAREIFDRFDLNGDGRITPEELRQVLVDSGIDVETEDARRLIALQDRTGDGLLSFEEFWTARREMLRRGPGTHS
ncbi:EF-hand domain-containing protein [Streptomyces sp. ST2-7A]|uniref:EF-hand domain-containing protein n=1 Tax=Streptomyces sp. ST2-7A TaxID=2907214 RepID=UPI001F2E2A24|nr:EF-hand domain-containing protein [Streptomyces sp. ST2-7A]MCE7080988.1 EF-hand domain-containing protein [Streptomyces sp. ST2-7A]